MKKILITLNLTIFTYIFFFLKKINAATVATIKSPITVTSIPGMIIKISSVIRPLTILGFIVCVSYAGFVRMTALGNAEKEGKSVKIATAAAIGFAIITLAPVLVVIIARMLGLDPNQYVII